MNYTSKSALPKHASINKKRDRRSAINVLVMTKSIRRIIKQKLSVHRRHDEVTRPPECPLVYRHASRISVARS